MLRLFSGLELPDAIRTSLAGLQSGVKQVRWITAETMHITLCFIGEVEEPLAQSIDEALGRIRQRGFSLSCVGVGVFGSHPVRALWSGIENHEELTTLQEANIAAVRATGWPLQRRRYRPHVTLARTRGTAHQEIGKWLATHGLFRSDEFHVKHFTLFSSHLGRESAVYRAEARYPLEAAEKA